MVLNAFSLLRTRPIHKEAKLSVNHCYCNQHVDRDPKCSDASEETEDQSQSTEELGSDGQKRKHGRNVHGSGKETHRAGKAIAAEPPEHLLCSMGEEHDAKD